MVSSKNKANLYLVCGYMASGKSTVSNELKNTIDAKLITTDDLRKDMFPLEFDYKSIGFVDSSIIPIVNEWFNSNDLELIDFQQVLILLRTIGSDKSKAIVGMCLDQIKIQKAKVYDSAFNLLDTYLSCGYSVIFDAIFSNKSLRDRAYSIASSNGLDEIYLLQVVCGEDTVKASLEARIYNPNLTTSNAKQLEIYHLQKSEFDKSHIELDNPKDLDLKRLVYHTDTNEIESYGCEDSIVLGLKSVFKGLTGMV
ncbi:MAG: AAA family ATPase [DPANN group archaeon]|nr:AAA family ATPase [DPANN group archaeon]